MAGEVENKGGRRAAPGLTALIGRYKYVLLVLLAGVVCLLWPSGRDRPPSPVTAEEAAESSQEDITALQREMESILGKIQGVGQLQLMLTLERGTERRLAENGELDYSGTPAAPDSYRRSSETVVLSQSGSGESVVVVEEICPRFRGALVVCEGGDLPSVRLAVVEAVSALTGLGSDRISVVKWQQ